MVEVRNLAKKDYFFSVDAGMDYSPSSMSLSDDETLGVQQQDVHQDVQTKIPLVAVIHYGEESPDYCLPIYLEQLRNLMYVSWNFFLSDVKIFELSSCRFHNTNGVKLTFVDRIKLLANYVHSKMTHDIDADTSFEHSYTVHIQQIKVENCFFLQISSSPKTLDFV